MSHVKVAPDQLKKKIFLKARLSKHEQMSEGLFSQRLRHLSVSHQFGAHLETRWHRPRTLEPGRQGKVGGHGKGSSCLEAVPEF